MFVYCDGTPHTTFDIEVSNDTRTGTDGDDEEGA